MAVQNRRQRFISSVVMCALVACSVAGTGGGRRAEARQGSGVTAEGRALVERISADSLRGHLSFIAADALEGRNTPSRGLDLAAEYIAAQFRRAGLEAVGDDGYFQTANWSVRERNLEGFALSMQANGRTVGVASDEVSLSFETGGRALFSVDAPLALENAGAFKIDYRDAAALDALKVEQLEGKVVLTEIPDLRLETDRARRSAMFDAERKFLARMSALKAALVLSVERRATKGNGRGSGRLRDPEASPAASAQTAGGRGNASPSAPLITVHNAEWVKLYDELGAGANAGGKVTLRLNAPLENPVKVRNVVGLLRGSDAALKDTYVIVSAHYDHLGMLTGATGDNIYNGANDDGSGTVSVVELASAFGALKRRPKRSILFMTFFGEEKGLLGSRYYGRHPVVPIEKTVAQINLEQVGRTDDSEGPQVSTATVTGFDYTDIGEILIAAGERVGVRFYKHARNSDAFFGRSDNQSLADRGVPAHTVGVAFEFPDYHGLEDEWEKIDYANMERVDRAVALGVLTIADNPQPPKWNEANPQTAPYVKALRERKP
jgi:hypothetical protein